jgi:hypothetical protein
LGPVWRRLNKYGEPPDLRGEFHEQVQPFEHQIHGEERETCDVSFRSPHVRHKACGDNVSGYGDDRQVFGRLLCGGRCSGSDRDDDLRMKSQGISRKHRQLRGMPLCRTMVDGDGRAGCVSERPQTLLESTDLSSG